MDGERSASDRREPVRRTGFTVLAVQVAQAGVTESGGVKISARLDTKLSGLLAPASSPSVEQQQQPHSPSV